jgi:hypothetical protein
MDIKSNELREFINNQLDVNKLNSKLKRTIQSNLYFPAKCCVCYNKEKSSIVVCNKCYNYICISCFNNINIKNKCPLCRNIYINEIYILKKQTFLEKIIYNLHGFYIWCINKLQQLFVNKPKPVYINNTITVPQYGDFYIFPDVSSYRPSGHINVSTARPFYENVFLRTRTADHEINDLMNIHSDLFADD